MRIHIDEKSYGETPVLKDIDLELSAGARIALIGSSGIGKSTFLRIVAGLDDEYQGEVTDRPRQIGMVFQEPFLMNWRNALANLTLMTSCSEADARAALKAVELEGLETRLPQALSVGQQRRVSLARALVAKPKLLILDEAFASLDDVTAAHMRDCVNQYVEAHDTMLILATHQKQDLELAQTVMSLEGGQLTAQNATN